MKYARYAEGCLCSQRITAVVQRHQIWDDNSDFLGDKMGKLSIFLLVILSWLQYSLWLGKNGVHTYTRIQHEVVAQQESNTKLKSRNEQLFAEIDDLSSGLEAIEERARDELGMVKPGETFYRILPADKTTK